MKRPEHCTVPLCKNKRVYSKPGWWCIKHWEMWCWWNSEDKEKPLWMQIPKHTYRELKIFDFNLF